MEERRVGFPEVSLSNLAHQKTNVYPTYLDLEDVAGTISMLCIAMPQGHRPTDIIMLCNDK